MHCLMCLFFFFFFLVEGEKNMCFWRESFSDRYCTGCLTHRHYHHVKLWSIPFLLKQSTGSVVRGCWMSRHKDTVPKSLTGESCSFISSEWVFFCVVLSLESHVSLRHLSLCGFAQNEWLWLLRHPCSCCNIFNLPVEASPVQICCRSSGPA